MKLILARIITLLSSILVVLCIAAFTAIKEGASISNYSYAKKNVFQAYSYKHGFKLELSTVDQYASRFTAMNSAPAIWMTDYGYPDDSWSIRFGGLGVDWSPRPFREISVFIPHWMIVFFFALIMFCCFNFNRKRNRSKGFEAIEK